MTSKPYSGAHHDAASSGRADVRPHRLSELTDHGRRAWRLLRDKRVPAWQKAIPVLTLLYILSPIDVMPEALFGPFGLVDDVVVALLALKAFNHLAGPYAPERRAAVGGTGAADDDDDGGPTIEVPYRAVE